jgi:hypothetical protein
VVKKGVKRGYKSVCRSATGKVEGVFKRNERKEGMDLFISFSNNF